MISMIPRAVSRFALVGARQQPKRCISSLTTTSTSASRTTTIGNGIPSDAVVPRLLRGSTAFASPSHKRSIPGFETTAASAAPLNIAQPYHGQQQQLLLVVPSVLGHHNAILGAPTREDSILDAIIQASNRNNRRPKKANKGSRPCSRAGRRRRKESIGKRSRGS